MARDKAEFIRFVKGADGSVSVDESKKAAGRGAYVCKDGDCLLKAKKTHALNRAFKMPVDESVIDKAREIYESKN